MPPPRLRPRRHWAWVLAGGAFLGGVLCLGLLLFPPLQGWLLRRWAKTQPGWRLDFTQIGVGPTGADARSLEFAMPGVAASSEPISIRVAPLRLFSRRELLIERMEAHKILLTVTPAELPASPPFRGVLHWLRAPLSWALEAAQLEGAIVVREAGESRLTGTFSLQGGGLEPAAPGEFTYSLTTHSELGPPGPKRVFTSSGTIRLTPSTGHGIGRITLTGDLHPPPEGGLVLPPGQITLEVSAAPGGELYAVHLRMGAAFSIDAEATLDAAKLILTGQAMFQADPSVAANLGRERPPRLAAAGHITFTENLRSGDIDAVLTGDFSGGDWQNLLPQMAALDALRGHLEAAIARHGEQIVLTRFAANAAGEHSSATASLILTQPCRLEKGNAGARARVAFAHLPVAWANPLLADRGLPAASGEFSAEGTIALERGGSVRFTPERPAALERLAFRAGERPALSPLTITFLPEVEASPTRVALTLGKVTVVSPTGDRAGGQVAISRDGATGEIHTRGEFQGAIPTLFAGADGSLRFTVDAGWDAALSGARLHLATLDITARGDAQAAPFLEAKLQRPFDFDWQKRQVMAPPTSSASSLPSPPTSPDWLHLSFSHFPLAWLARWLPGRTVEGTLAAGESALRPTPDGGIAWITSVPWRSEGLALGLASEPTPMRIAAQLSPQITWSGDHFAMRVDDLAISDGNGDRLSGQVGATVALAKKNVTVELALEADLPALPHSQETFGPLRARLQAKFHKVTPRIIGADQFKMNVRTSSTELLALEAPLPFLFGLSGSDSVVVSTLAPLRLKFGRFPLGWLSPWTGGVALGGLVSPAELSLSASMNIYSVKSAGPWNVEGFTALRDGRKLIGDATATFTPGLDLTLVAVTRPSFQVAYTGVAQFAGLQMRSGGRSALELDLGLGFAGNDKIVYPQRLDLNSRVDFAAWPTASALGLPARGTLTARAKGDLLGGQPLQMSARLEGLPAGKTGETLPPLQASLLGNLSKDNVITGEADLLLATSPRPTDAEFTVQLNLADGGLNVTSGFHSQFVDGAVLLALADAFSRPGGPPLPPAARLTNTSRAGRSPPSPLTLPFWGELGGSFDLDIGTLQFAPYRIDHVRGRLEAGPRELDLRELSGDMFAGRWGGSVQVTHDPQNPKGGHRLAADFRIDQIESARVVQAVFPHQLPSIDARLNVHARVASEGDSLLALIDHSTADFSVDGAKGVVRLTVPREDLLSTAAVFGGTVLLSPELRALGRLMKTFAEMPVGQLRITGRRTANGELTLDEFRLDSPEVRVRGQGRNPADESEPLMNRPLSLSLELAAKDDLAVILGDMSLLEKKPQGDGFRPMRRPFSLGGRVGAPDTTPLYDLLARAVAGSKGTWGFLMRKVQAEIVKKKPPAGQGPP